MIASSSLATDGVTIEDDDCFEANQNGQDSLEKQLRQQTEQRQNQEHQQDQKQDHQQQQRQQEDIDHQSAIQLQNRLFQPDDGMDGTSALLSNIASYLTFSDATSLASLIPPTPNRRQDDVVDEIDESDSTTEDSWAVGVEFDGSFWNINTPPTPAIIAISPGATPRPSTSIEEDLLINDVMCCDVDHQIGYDDTGSSLVEVLRERRRRWAQEKITAAVFAHPKSLRSYCVEAFDAAMKIKERKETMSGSSDPETLRETCEHIQRKRKRTKQGKGIQLLHLMVDVLFQNVSLQVILDVVKGLSGLSLDTTVASFQITITSLNKIVSVLGQAVKCIWNVIKSFNPLQLLEAIISLQFNAMGKTSEVLASGIQSVATGVGSASSMALYRLSTANLSASRLESSSSLTINISQRVRRTTSDEFLKQKLLRKLSTINDAALVVSYREFEDDTGGLTKQAVTRTRRMMHYTVPLRPFLATVAISPCHDSYGSASNKCRPSEGSCGDLSFSSSTSLSLEAESDDSPFMCTPQSFPPTPHSRQMVIAQRAQFSDDVVFIARDRLRVHDGLESEDERTRQRSRVLAAEKRLAIFTVKDPSSGIELSCGRHIATKVGHMYYASTRSMVPILRNCYVYFELTVLPPLISNAVMPTQPATLSIGLSTEEMPPNTLVGAWQGSVGLCTTGQILMAGQWCSPADPMMSSYGTGATVGCLVYLDDESAFETWDGVMVNAIIRFNVNGTMVSQPVSTLPMSGAPTSQLPGTGNQGNANSSLVGATIVSSSASPSATLTLLVQAVEDLYPTVTLQSSGTAVVCRFSSEDVAANTRITIGAPDGVVVYAVDGSVILNENE